VITGWLTLLGTDLSEGDDIYHKEKLVNRIGEKISDGTVFYQKI